MSIAVVVVRDSSLRIRLSCLTSVLPHELYAWSAATRGVPDWLNFSLSWIILGKALHAPYESPSVRELASGRHTDLAKPNR